MKIFITIPWFLPAYRAGGPIQSVANLIKNVNENIEYFIFCGDRDLNGEELPGIKKGEWVEYNSYTQIWYASKENLNKNFTVQTAIIKPDCLYIIGLFDWDFNIVPLLFGKTKTKILSARGMLHPGALSQKRIKKAFFLQFLKLLGITNKIIFHATDDLEKHFIKNNFGEKAIVRVADNFAGSMLRLLPANKTENSLSLITIALISPMKNHLLVLKSLMLCTSIITYNIYGPIKEAAYWQECKLQITLLPNNITVKYHGEITPNEINKMLSNSHVFIMPSKSENFGHAIAEALGAGLPVITSDFTPWVDLEKNNAGFNVLLTEESITKAITHFAVLNQYQYDKTAQAAFDYFFQKNNLAEKKVAYKILFS